MCLPILNLFVRYDALLRGWCVVYVGDVSVKIQYIRTKVKVKSKDNWL
jgi:hypothetical protein